MKLFTDYWNQKVSWQQDIVFSIELHKGRCYNCNCQAIVLNAYELGSKQNAFGICMGCFRSFNPGSINNKVTLPEKPTYDKIISVFDCLNPIELLELEAQNE